MITSERALLVLRLKLVGLIAVIVPVARPYAHDAAPNVLIAAPPPKAEEIDDSCIITRAAIAQMAIIGKAA